MPVVWAICRRDLLAAFTTPLAWLVIACWTMLTDFVFVWGLFQVHGTAGAGEPLYVSSLQAGVWFLTLLAPAITMNTFASELAQGTMQLLLTVPVREIQLVAGKFLAAFALLAILVAVTLVQPAVLAFISAVDGPQLAAGYLGMLLACAFFAALGVWVSILVDSPVAAYVLSFAAIMVLALLGLAEDGPMHAIGQAVGLESRTRAFFAGEVRLGDVAWFLAASAGLLCLSHAALCARRIHG